MKKSPITTHVLDTSLGRPAAGVRVTIERIAENGEAVVLAAGTTNEDGRIMDLLPVEPRLEVGVYRVTFDTGGYFAAQGVTGFYPNVVIAFNLSAPEEHHHIPLLLSPYGYSTYRGC